MFINVRYLFKVFDIHKLEIKFKLVATGLCFINRISILCNYEERNLIKIYAVIE